MGMSPVVASVNAAHVQALIGTAHNHVIVATRNTARMVLDCTDWMLAHLRTCVCVVFVCACELG